MGETVLDRGLRPMSRRELGPSADVQLEWLWIMVSFHTHQFRGRPMAEALASWTTILLIHKGCNPTIRDIATASGLPRPTVSRYVNTTIQQGWAHERVNVRNRRRRELHLTESGHKELERIVEFFHAMYDRLMASQPAADESVSGTEYLERLEQMTANISGCLGQFWPDPENDHSRK